MEKKNRAKYISDFQRENYDRYNLLLPKGTKEQLQLIAKNKAVSVNALINMLISDCIAQNSTEQNPGYTTEVK